MTIGTEIISPSPASVGPVTKPAPKTSGERRRRRLRAAEPPPAPVDDAAHPVRALLAELGPVFQALGLNQSQSTVLQALILARPAPANSLQLAQAAGIPRTSVYATIEELTAKGLTTEVEGKSMCWVSVGA